MKLKDVWKKVKYQENIPTTKEAIKMWNRLKNKDLVLRRSVNIEGDFEFIIYIYENKAGILARDNDSYLIYFNDNINDVKIHIENTAEHYIKYKHPDFDEKIKEVFLIEDL